MCLFVVPNPNSEAPLVPLATGRPLQWTSEWCTGLLGSGAPAGPPASVVAAAGGAVQGRFAERSSTRSLDPVTALLDPARASQAAPTPGPLRSPWPTGVAAGEGSGSGLGFCLAPGLVKRVLIFAPHNCSAVLAAAKSYWFFRRRDCHM